MAQFGVLFRSSSSPSCSCSSRGEARRSSSQPRWLQYLTFLLPARHFVSFSQIIIYRGGGLSAVWRQFLIVSAIGLAFFVYSLVLFRKSIARIEINF